VCTLGGDVEFAGPDGKAVVVAAGEGSAAGEGGGVGQPAMVAAAEIQALRSETDAEQSPTALAWNVQVGDKDRLRSRGAGGLSLGGDVPLERVESGKSEQPPASGNFFGGTLGDDSGQTEPFNATGGWGNGMADRKGGVTLTIHVP
jgi:hypothetical protein